MVGQWDGGTDGKIGRSESVAEWKGMDGLDCMNERRAMGGEEVAKWPIIV
jgi:hypothetical protein